MSRPPAQPSYIFRGHIAQIHATTFIRSNSRLVTGDADGVIVVWNLSTRRASAVWKAHEGAILGFAEWGVTRLITHGKDNKIAVWKFEEEDEAGLSKQLPVDSTCSEWKQPWLLHVLEVNTLNFCSLSVCEQENHATDTHDIRIHAETDFSNDILIAVPNTLKPEAVDIFQLPSEKRLETVPGDKSVNQGMVMAVSIFYHHAFLTLAAGYESGHTTLLQKRVPCGWTVLYTLQAHTQPVLSLDICLEHSCYFTSSADALVVKHPIPDLGIEGLKGTTEHHASEKSIPRPVTVRNTPLKIAQTKHAGQQSLKIRSDGKIFATAGWDARVRVYSMQSMKELAVLKWHKDGCYSVAFARVRDHEALEYRASAKPLSRDGDDDVGTLASLTSLARLDTEHTVAMEVAFRSSTISITQKRLMKTETAHWLAVGSKDGKVSLWEIY